MSNIPPTGPGSSSQNPTPAGESPANSLFERIAQVALPILGSPTGPATPRQSSDEAANFATFHSRVREGIMGDIEHLIPKSKGNLIEHFRKVLVKAAQDGRLEIVLALLAGANISDVDRGLAVRNAALGGRLDIIQALLQNGPISDVDRGGAVVYAAFNRHFEIVLALLPDDATTPPRRSRGCCSPRITGRAY